MTGLFALARASKCLKRIPIRIPAIKSWEGQKLTDRHAESDRDWLIRSFNIRLGVVGKLERVATARSNELWFWEGENEAVLSVGPIPQP